MRTVDGWAAAVRSSAGRSARMRLPFTRKESLFKKVMKSNELTGMIVRYGGMALLAILAITEIPAVIRYVNMERM
jgi:hypothetical protein